MATVNVKERTISEVESVALELSEEEALYVAAMLGIGNSYTISGVYNDVYGALVEALDLHGGNSRRDRRFNHLIERAYDYTRGEL